MSKEEIEIYRRLMKERSSKGGKKAWKGKSRAERKRIMSERQKKRWARTKAAAETPATEPEPDSAIKRITE